MQDQRKTPQLPQCKDRCKKYCTSVSKSPSNFTLKICLLPRVSECKERKRVLEAANVLYETGTVIRWQHAGVSGADAKLISLLFNADFHLFSICLQSSLIFSFDDLSFVLNSGKNKHRFSFLSCLLSLFQAGYYSYLFSFILSPDVSSTLVIKRNVSESSFSQ